MVFQDQGRPRGNINKKDNRDFPTGLGKTVTLTSPSPPGVTNVTPNDKSRSQVNCTQEQKQSQKQL